jgi:hypothetical protein
MMLSKRHLIAVVFTLGFVVISQVSNNTLTTLWDYVVSDPKGSANGVVIVSKLNVLRWGITTYDIRYQYVVSGQAYVSSQIDYNTKGVDAEGMVERYPVGKEVVVYYDVAKPKYSTLLNDGLGVGVYKQLFGYFFAVIFFYYIGRAWE